MEKKMTLQEAIQDKNRPLSVPPQQWMQYEQAKEIQQQQLLDNEVKRIVADEIQSDEIDNIVVDAQQSLDIGIQQMILGCRIAIRALQQLNRKNVTIDQRNVYNQIQDLMHNAIAPYLSDILKSRKRLYK